MSHFTCIICHDPLHEMPTPGTTNEADQIPTASTRPPRDRQAERSERERRRARNRRNVIPPVSPTRPVPQNPISRTEVVVTPCGHLFHHVCVLQWFLKIGKRDCPCCRRSCNSVKYLKRIFPAIELHELNDVIANLERELKSTKAELSAIKWSRIQFAANNSNEIRKLKQENQRLRSDIASYKNVDKKPEETKSSTKRSAASHNLENESAEPNANSPASAKLPRIKGGEIESCIIA